MRQDQLQKARHTRWRQDGNALLTLDDAERWLAENSLCLYLPRYQHIPAPAPSFVEAIAGRPDPMPAPEQIAAASQMLARLVASGAAIALNLFGSASGIVGEQPDFLATPEALPYLYALQSQRNPKRPPTTTGAARVSPLAVEAFQILTREGALTATELRERLGREVTEAATLRALGELWHALRVVPVPDEQGAPAHWELLTARHGRELSIGSTQSQTTALSILVSFYLQSAVAATAEEAEVFLSPLAPRSRIRDVIHGLSATRQVASFSLNGEAQLHVEGTLPEILEEEIPAAEVVTPAGRSAELDANLDAGLEQNEPSFTEAAARKPIGRRPSFADRARGRFTPRKPEQRTERPPRRGGGFRPPQRRSFGDRERVPKTDQGERRPFDRQDRPPRQDRPERTDRRRPQGGFERKRSEQRPEGREPRFEKRSFNREDRFSKQRPGAAPARREGEHAPRRDKEQASERRPFRREGQRPPFAKSKERRPFREGGEQRPFRKDRPQRPFRRDGEARPFSKDRPFRKDGEARPFRQNRSERPFRPERPEGKFRKDRPARPFNRDRQDRPFRKPAGERPPRRDAPSRPPNRPWTERPPRSGDRERSHGVSSRPNEGERRNRPGRREGERPSQGERPPFRKSSEGPGKPFRPRNFEGGRPGNRPPGKGPFRPGKPGGKRFDNRGAGGPDRGGKRPGGSAPPSRKPRRDSGEGDEG